MKIAFDETTKYQFKHPVGGEPLFALDKKGKPDKSKPMEAVIYGTHTAHWNNAVNDSLKKVSDQDEDEDIDKSRNELISHGIKQFNNMEGLETEFGDFDPNDKLKALDVWWIKKQINKALARMDLFIQE